MSKRLFVNIIFIILLVGLGTYFFFHFNLHDLFVNKEKIINFINSFGPFSALIFILIQILQVLIAPIPGEITGIIGGYLYGPVLGLFYSTIGLTLGSWAAFSLSRFFGLPFVERAVKPEFLKKYDYIMSHKGVWISFALFLIPGFPKDYLCYILGLSHLQLWTFLAISTVGRFFGTALLSFSGGLARADQVMPLILLLVFAGGVFIVVFFFRKKWLSMLKHMHYRSIFQHHSDKHKSIRDEKKKDFGKS